MYNRYVPTPDGGYRKQSVPEGPPPKPVLPPSEPNGLPKPPECPQPVGSFLARLLPEGLDTEDLIVVLLLLFMSGGKGSNTSLITLLVYLFL